MMMAISLGIHMRVSLARLRQGRPQGKLPGPKSQVLGLVLVFLFKISQSFWSKETHYTFQNQRGNWSFFQIGQYFMIPGY